MGHTVSDSSSSTIVWCVSSSHPTLPSRRLRWFVILSLCGRNVSSSIPAYSLKFVSLTDVCPASIGHTFSPQGYELLFLSSILSVDERRSWRRMGSSCVRWLPSYYRHVRLTAVVDTSRRDRNWQMFFNNLRALGWFSPSVRQFEGGTPATCVV